MARLCIFLVTAALIAGIAGCGGDGNTPCTTPPPSQNLEIQTWYDLDAVRDNLAGNHTLMNNLDSTTPGYEELASPTTNEGKGWQPIGTFIPECPYGGFTGTLDGQGYEIRDLYINRLEESKVGLFGYVQEEGVIKDIGVVNVTVVGKGTVGNLVGWNDGTVYNSSSIGSVTGEDMVGGLVGLSRGSVSYSYSTGNVIGANSVGGLGGSNSGTVINSYSTSSVTGNERVGGLVGRNFHGTTVLYSYSTGGVTGNEDVGGLVGYNWQTIVSDCFWDIETSGQATSDGGTGKNTTEMKSIATFSMVGWNIIAVALNETNPAYIWNIVNNVTYPFLSWEP